jgi:hypothetical protein
MHPILQQFVSNSIVVAAGAALGVSFLVYFVSDNDRIRPVTYDQQTHDFA